MELTKKKQLLKLLKQYNAHNKYGELNPNHDYDEQGSYWVDDRQQLTPREYQKKVKDSPQLTVKEFIKVLKQELQQNWDLETTKQELNVVIPYLNKIKSVRGLWKYDAQMALGIFEGGEQQFDYIPAWIAMQKYITKLSDQYNQ